MSIIRVFEGFSKNTRLTALALSSLLAALQLLKAVKDSLAIEAGLDKLQWSITGSFLLIGFLSIISSRPKWNNDRVFSGFSFILIVGLAMGIFIPNSSMFYILISAFSLILISQFWKVFVGNSVLKNDIRSITLVAVVGSLGGIVGPFLSVLGIIVGTNGLIVLAILLITASNMILYNLSHDPSRNPKASSSLISATVSFKGLWMAIFVIAYAAISTFIYVKQLEIIEQEHLSIQFRTVIFGIRDCCIGVLILLVQRYLSVRKDPLKSQLSMLPVISLLVLALINVIPSLGIVIIAIVVFKSYNFAFVRPAREIFFSKSPSIVLRKNLFDALFYRSGDLIAIWLLYSMDIADWSNFAKAILLIPILGCWFLACYKIQLLINEPI